MTTRGRGNQLTRQIGEHLVTAELGRRGYIATPFSGNVPMFDLVATDIEGRAVPIQVKAINGPSWQFSATSFLEIDIVDGEQIVRGKRRLGMPELLCIFVLLKRAGEDEFYIFRYELLQAIFANTYKGGRRPKNPESVHCAIWPSELSEYRDNWDLIDSVLGARQTAPGLG